ncbi:MAG TPA: two-component regulator propeller domain-containing protein [Cytophagaceae bacterium]
MLIKIVAPILILFFSVRAFGQKPRMIFQSLSISEGLSENTIRSIMEDHKGFMWFATEDGLNRFDGYNFSVYKKELDNIYSVSSNNIKSIFRDSKNNLWILTRNGLNLYNPSKEKFYNFRNNDYPVFQSLTGDFSQMAEDPDGNLWVVAGEDGLYKIESLHKPARHYLYQSPSGQNQLYSVLASKSEVLVGSQNGLLRLDLATNEFISLGSHYGDDYDVRKILKDQSGNLWLGTTDGLKVITKDGKLREYKNNPSEPHSLKADNVVDIMPYGNGSFLIGIDGGGIDYFDVTNEKFYHYYDELSSNNITCLFTDSKGDRWAGTFLNGINFSNQTTNLFVLEKNNPNSDKAIKKGIITYFLKDSRGNFWISTDGGGLYKKDKSGKLFHYEEGKNGLTSNAIISLKEDIHGTIWVSTYGGGLCKYDHKTNTFKAFLPIPSDPLSISGDKVKDLCFYKGKLWMSMFGTGLCVLDTNSNRFIHHRNDKADPHTVPTDWIQNFLIDKDDELWFGSVKGLSKYDTTTGTFKNLTFQIKNVPTDDINSITDIVQGPDGNLWLGTSGSGIICFNKYNSTYQVYTVKDGLSNNSIKSLLFDNKNNLWVCTNYGITKFDINSRKGKAYTIRDGVPPSSYYFNAKYKDEEGRIYFGGNNGYLMIDPSMTLENKNIPPIVITEFKIFNQTIKPGDKSILKNHISYTDEIHLPYNQNSFTFEFTALNFNNAQNNNYAYILEGFDQDWVIAGHQRSATYTNVNPGTYIFRVKGSNNDNVWNEKGAFVKIIIAPPFWYTWWFMGITGGLILLSLYLIYHWRVRGIRNKNLLLEETVTQRTSELQEANKQLETLLYRASHDIKGPLKSIIGLTTVGSKDVSDEKALQYFNHILKSTKKLDWLLVDILEITKIKQSPFTREKISFETLVNEAITSFKNFTGFEQINFKIDIKEDGSFHSDKNLVYSLIQNLIENPIKYADSNKPECYLKITINAVNERARLKFEDNGIGIPLEFQDKVFEMFFKANEYSKGSGLGLYIVKTTVDKLKGKIQMESTPGIGTTFYVDL